MNATLAAVAVLAALALAGCNDSGPREVEVAPGQVVTVQEPLDPDNGAVAGIVGDDAIYPLPGALVRIIGLDLNATTDDNGRFAIVDVPPGIYILEGSKKDHAAVQTTVDVQPDKVAKAVLLLPRVPPTDPYHLTVQHEGYIEFAGAGVSMDSNTTFHFSLDPSPPKTVVLESKWGDNWVTTGQRPPLVYTITDPGQRVVDSDEVPNPFSLHLDARILTPGHSMFGVRIEPTLFEPIVFQGRSQDFVTVFYNEPAPSDWSILAGSV